MRGASGVIAAAVAFLTFASPTNAIVRPVTPIIIDDDGGGGIDTHVKWYRRLADSGVPVQIKGMCISACTLFLGILPHGQACIERTASLGFHLASYADKPDVNLTMALATRYYPPALLRWLADKPMREEPYFMLAAEAVAIGIVPACAIVKTERGEE